MDKRSAGMALVLLTMCSEGVVARTGIPSATQGLYYEIGGGDVIREPLGTGNALAGVGVSADLKIGGFSCDSWDGLHLNLDAYGDMIEDHLDQAIEGLQRQIVESMLGLARGYATAALQRSLPGLYDWSMNVRSQLDTKTGDAKASCEAVLADMDSNVDPLASWKRNALSYDWSLDIQAGREREAGGANEGPTTVIRAQRENSQAVGEQDLPWFGSGGRAGGASGEEIEVVHDSVVAGYVQHAGGDDLANESQVADGEVIHSSLSSVTPTATVTRLSEMWKTADEAGEWVTSVVGESIVSLCEECDPSTKAGTGLSAKVHEEKNRLKNIWRDFLGPDSDIRYLTVGELEMVSSTKTLLTQDVMIALAQFPIQDREMLVTRLVGDVAAANTIEKAFAARTLLRSALTTPELQGNKPAQETLHEKIDLLRREIDEVMFEIETNRRLLSDTPSGILALYEAKKSAAAQRPRMSPGLTTKTKLQDNAVRP